MRRFYLPTLDDDPQNLARALWLDKHEHERQKLAVMSAVAELFKK
ncbi:DUF6890 family protein [Vibrio quintilis]